MMRLRPKVGGPGCPGFLRGREIRPDDLSPGGRPVGRMGEWLQATAEPMKVRARRGPLKDDDVSALNGFRQGVYA